MQWGDEHSVNANAERTIQRARCRPQWCEQFAMYWQATAWTLAISLQNGDTFQEATSKIMKDLDKFNEFMAREIAADKKKQPLNETNPSTKVATKSQIGTARGHRRVISCGTRPHRPHNPLQLTPNFGMKGENVIVLSAFDGIGAGIYALQEIIGRPRLAI